MLPDGLQEGSRGYAIDSPVIECQAQRHHMPPLGFPSDAHELLVQTPNAENGNFRWVDDGRECVDSIHAQVGHTEGAAHDLFTCEGTLTRTQGKSRCLLRDFPQRLAISITHYRYDQALIQS